MDERPQDRNARADKSDKDLCRSPEYKDGCFPYADSMSEAISRPDVGARKR